MNLTVTYAEQDSRDRFIVGVVDVVIEPADPDKRTQAERNAQNALDAARLARVEAHLGQLRGALAGLPGTSKVLVEPVLAKLDEALEARVS